jgi:hypothetical protein
MSTREGYGILSLQVSTKGWGIPLRWAPDTVLGKDQIKNVKDAKDCKGPGLAGAPDARGNTSTY